MNAITLAKLYDLLSLKLGKEAAENLATFIEYKINTDMENKSQLFATKEDISRLELNIRAEIGNLRAEISNTKVQIGNSKVDMIKWMFGFWITIMLMFVGLYLK